MLLLSGVTSTPFEMVHGYFVLIRCAASIHGLLLSLLPLVNPVPSPL
jgi:hypothetical protein